jgi:endo-1,4-beta-xylanase
MFTHLFPAAAFVLVSATVSSSWGVEPVPPTLRSVYGDDFLIGVALNPAQIDSRNPKAGEIAAKQFSAITPENAMKWQAVHPRPDRYEFRTGDAYAEFAAKGGMKLIGHTLVWHSQTPPWVFQGEDGKPPTREQLLERMRDHIHTVVGHYKGKVKGWDVVNEAISDGGPDLLRDSPWRRIIGDDFIDQAFRFAKEADPDAELYYNDYGLEDGEKRRKCLALLRGLIDRGVPITGVGTQSHFDLNSPPIATVEKTIEELAGLGLKVMVTELDVDVLPHQGNAGNADISRREKADAGSDPYVKGLPDDVQQMLAKRYGDLFEVYLRHRGSISRVTLWGLDDGSSWLNWFPVPGRTNHPLLIDRSMNPKPAFFSVLKKGQENR